MKRPRFISVCCFVSFVMPFQRGIDFICTFILFLCNFEYHDNSNTNITTASINNTDVGGGK